MVHKNVFNFLFLEEISKKLSAHLVKIHTHTPFVRILLLINNLILVIFINGTNLKQQDCKIKLKIVIQKNM